MYVYVCMNESIYMYVYICMNECVYIYMFIRFLFKDSQVLCYKKFVKNSTDLLVS